MSNSLQLHGLQHSRSSCLSPTPGAYSNSCPLSQWCHPTIPSSVVPCLLLPSIFPSIRVFPDESGLCIRWQKYWSFSFSISPSNEYSGLIYFRIAWVWASCSPRDSQESSPTLQFKSINSLVLSLLYGPTLTSIHDYWKNRSLTRWTFVGKVMSLLFHMLSRLVIAFLPRSNHLFYFMAAVTICIDFGPQDKKVSMYL